MSRIALPLLVLVAGCEGAHHMLDPAGPQAGRIANLLLLFIVISAAVYLLVLAALALAVRAGNRRRRRDDSEDGSPAFERRLARAVAGGAIATAAVLLLYVAASASTGRALASLPTTLDSTATPLTIKVTGHQWWWEIEYADTAPSRRLITANELHIPVGRPVKIEGSAADVIHSFWVP